MNVLRGLLPVLCVLAIPGGEAAAQWTVRRPVTISLPSGNPATDLQVPIVADFGTTDIRTDGGDLRFATAAGAPSQSFDLPYFIEEWNHGGTSVVWVLVPAIPANTPVTIYAFHGHGAATTTSNFIEVFPSSIVIADDMSLGGDQAYDWFELLPGRTLTVPPGTPLSITGRRVVLDGTIDANGSGHPPAAATFADGTGPGAGNGSATAAGGGGGYGGPGGASSGTSANAGGPTYGSASGGNIAMGSSGGSGDASSPGGSGGGMVTVTAARLDFTGVIEVLGGSAEATFGLAGGGGSGGGVLLRAYDLHATGAISAAGGNGGSDLLVTNGGGGGGGGRIQLLSEQASTGSPVLSALGGAGGPGGSVPAEQGGHGTTFTGDGIEHFDYDEAGAVLGPPETLVGVGDLPIARVGLPTPNPSLDGVAFRLDLVRPHLCTVEIVDVGGRLVRRLVERELAAGGHELAWNLADERGRAVPAGLYLASVRIGERGWTRRIVVVR